MGRVASHSDQWAIWRYGTVFNKDVICNRLWHLLINKTTGKALYLGPQPCRKLTCAKCAKDVAEEVVAFYVEKWKDLSELWFLEMDWTTVRDRMKKLASVNARARRFNEYSVMHFWTDMPQEKKLLVWASGDISGRKLHLRKVNAHEGINQLCDFMTVPGPIHMPLGTFEWKFREVRPESKGLYSYGASSVSKKVLQQAYELAAEELLIEGYRCDGTTPLPDPDLIVSLMQQKVEDKIKVVMDNEERRKRKIAAIASR